MEALHFHRERNGTVSLQLINRGHDLAGLALARQFVDSLLLVPDGGPLQPLAGLSGLGRSGMVPFDLLPERDRFAPAAQLGEQLGAEQRQIGGLRIRFGELIGAIEGRRVLLQALPGIKPLHGHREGDRSMLFELADGVDYLLVPELAGQREDVLFGLQPRLAGDVGPEALAGLGRGLR